MNIATITEENRTANVMHRAEDVEGICSAILRLKEDAFARETMRSNERRYLAKDVALYEEIFHGLAGDGILARRPSSSGCEDATGVGHHGW